MTIIIATGNGEQRSLLEIEGPLPGDMSKYGYAWKLYKYRITEAGQIAHSGEVHAIPDEGLLRLIHRITIDANHKTWNHHEH